MRTTQQLSVRLHGLPVGILEQDPDGRLSFRYQADVPCPLSISLPFSESQFDQKAVEAYFGGLLPESDLARTALGKTFGVSPYNTFSLLREIGPDCAGAVSLHPMDTPIVADGAVPLSGTPLSDTELAGYIEALPRKPLFIGVQGLRLSLAGVQDKASVCLIDGQVSIPTQGCPTTHILKPMIPDFEGTVENEYFCMRLAKRIGLPVATVQIRRALNISYLLVERYDRIYHDGSIRRLHQEDFCQAMGVRTNHKYQADGGPGLKECFELLAITGTPGITRNQLMKMVMFNYLIGNNDAHGKNFSLLYPYRSEIPIFSYDADTLFLKGYDEIAWADIQLAPMYDALSTRIYPSLTTKMAMKIGSRSEIDSIQARDWENLCKTVGYSYPLFKETFGKLAKQLVEACPVEHSIAVNDGIIHPVLSTITSFIEQQAIKIMETM